MPVRPADQPRVRPGVPPYGGNYSPSPYRNPVSAPIPTPAPVTNPDERPQAGIPVWSLVIALFVGAALAVLLVPRWVPVLGSSITAPEPTVYWYLSRASGLVSFILLWLSMASGLIISNRLARIWPGGYTAFDLHQFTSLLGLGFGVFHALILLGNQYIPYSLLQLLIPFANDAYRPVWVGLGQISIYLLALVSFTFYIRKQMGYRAWHVIHYLSYGVLVAALLHGIFSGTDSGNIWIGEMYWAGGVSLLLLTVYRIAISKMEPARK